MSIGQNIKTCQEIRQLSSEHLADKLNISIKTYGKIENGETSPSYKMLEAIATLLETDVVDLIKFNSSNIFNNYHQQGTYIANNYAIAESKEQLYQHLLKEKDERIALLENLLKAK